MKMTEEEIDLLAKKIAEELKRPSPPKDEYISQLERAILEIASANAATGVVRRWVEKHAQLIHDLRAARGLVIGVVAKHLDKK